MSKISSLVCLLFGLSIAPLIAQSNIDSLRRALNNVPADSAFTIYLNLSNQYSKLRKSDSAIHFSEKAMELAKTQNKKLALAHRQLSYAHSLNGELDLAKAIMYEGMKWAEIEGDTINLCYLYTQMGGLYVETATYDSSLYYCMKALSLATIPLQIITNRRNIALSYFYTGDVNKAISTQKETLSMSGDFPERTKIDIYENLAGFYYYEKKYDSSRYHYEMVYDLYEKEGRDYYRLRVLGNIASIEYSRKNYGEAIRLNRDIIHQSKLLKLDDDLRRIPYYNLSVNSKMLGRLEDAVLYLDTAERMNVRLQNERGLKQIIEERFKIDSLRGDQAAMIADLQRKIIFTDSVRKTKNDKQLAELKTQYETERKDREIDNLNQQTAIQILEIDKQQSQLIIGGLVASVVLLLGFLYYRHDKVKKERTSTELEQRFLRSQLNPHFIFNSMTAIQQYLEENEPEGASHYMGMFSTLMRQILENSRQEFITLAEEADMLENYLTLQKLRFKEQFDYQIIIDETLDEDYVGVPPMFAQPFIENSLEHGLFRKDGQMNQINIYFRYVSKQLIGLVIEDSGVGVSKEIAMKAHQSLATQITQERLANMQRTHEGKVGLDSQNIINELGDIYGYRINLTLPTRLVSI